jgi:CRP/FNR family transcriptional regulator, cyclic AMP receptor protein
MPSPHAQPRKPAEEDPLAAAALSDSLRALARRGAVRALRKGVQIITEGDQGDSLFIVLRGGLRAFSVAPDGREVTYAEYGPGEYVGEMSLDGGPRSANVETTCASVCVLVTRATLESHLADDPAFAFDLLAKVIRRARAATVSLKGIALNTVYGRLKLLLEQQARPDASGAAVWHAMPTQLAISRQLGCSREMVTRLLGDLEAGSYVRMRPREITLLRPLPAKW